MGTGLVDKTEVDKCICCPLIVILDMSYVLFIQYMYFACLFIRTNYKLDHCNLTENSFENQICSIKMSSGDRGPPSNLCQEGCQRQIDHSSNADNRIQSCGWLLLF